MEEQGHSPAAASVREPKGAGAQGMQGLGGQEEEGCQGASGYEHQCGGMQACLGLSGALASHNWEGGGAGGGGGVGGSEEVGGGSDDMEFVYDVYLPMESEGEGEEAGREIGRAHV